MAAHQHSIRARDGARSKKSPGRPNSDAGRECTPGEGREGIRELATTDIDGLLVRAKEYAEASLAEATRRAYRSDFVHFSEWCQKKRLSPLPAAPRTLIAYVVALGETHKMS